MIKGLIMRGYYDPELLSEVGDDLYHFLHGLIECLTSLMAFENTNTQQNVNDLDPVSIAGLSDCPDTLLGGYQH